MSFSIEIIQRFEFRTNKHAILFALLGSAVSGIDYEYYCDCTGILRLCGDDAGLTLDN